MAKVNTYPSLEAFGQAMVKRADDAVKNGSRLLKFVAIAVNDAVAEATPVDTGLAITNWKGSVGVADLTGADKPFVSGEKGSTFNENILFQRRAFLDAIEKHELGQDIFITNTLNYIGDLNRGSSPQADADYVRIAVTAAAKVATSVPLFQGPASSKVTRIFE